MGMYKKVGKKRHQEALKGEKIWKAARLISSKLIIFMFSALFSAQFEMKLLELSFFSFLFLNCKNKPKPKQKKTTYAKPLELDCKWLNTGGYTKLYATVSLEIHSLSFIKAVESTEMLIS